MASLTPVPHYSRIISLPRLFGPPLIHQRQQLVNYNINKTRMNLIRSEGCSIQYTVNHGVRVINSASPILILPPNLPIPIHLTRHHQPRERQELDTHASALGGRSYIQLVR